MAAVAAAPMLLRNRSTSHPLPLPPCCNSPHSLLHGAASACGSSSSSCSDGRGPVAAHLHARNPVALNVGQVVTPIVGEHSVRSSRQRHGLRVSRCETRLHGLNPRSKAHGCETFSNVEKCGALTVNAFFPPALRPRCMVCCAARHCMWCWNWQNPKKHRLCSKTT